MLRKHLDSAEPPELIVRTQRNLSAPIDVSPDGNFVAFTAGGSIVVAAIANGAKSDVFSNGFSERSSPDGNWIAYMILQGIYAQKFPERTPRVLVTDHGNAPVWRRDGKELFYRSPDGHLMAVEARESNASISFGAPRELFALPPNSVPAPYDVSADGQRFLLLVPEERGPSDREMTMLINWQAGLKK